MSISLLFSVITTFLATSTDDLTWLPLLLLAYPQRMLPVAAGYVLTTLLLDAACWWIAHVLQGELAITEATLSMLSYVGVLFVIYGVWMIIRWYRAADHDEEKTPDPANGLPFLAGVVAVVSNGWNNVIVLPAMFVSQPQLGVGYVVGIWVCNVLWAATAVIGVKVLHQQLAPKLARYGEAISGVALVLIGIKIVLN